MQNRGISVFSGKGRPRKSASFQSVDRSIQSMNDRFVVGPVPVVEDGTVRVDFNTLAVGHPVFPLTTILSSIFPCTGSVTMVLAGLPVAVIVATAVGNKGVDAISLEATVDEVSVVDSAVGPFENTPPMTLAAVEFSFVDAAIGPTIHTVTMSQVTIVHARVCITVGELFRTLAMPISESPEKVNNNTITTIR